MSCKELQCNQYYPTVYIEACQLTILRDVYAGIILLPGGDGGEFELELPRDAGTDTNEL